MPIRDKYFTGSSVSRYLPPGEHSWDEAVYQSGKPVLDSELNLSQEVGREIQKLLQDRIVPSGWVRGPIRGEYRDDDGLSSDYGTPAPGNPFFVADSFYLAKRTALVANMPVVVEYTNIATAGFNRIDLEAAPVFGGAPPDVKRTDFVFLEVWRCLVSHSPRATATTEVVNFANITAGDIIAINGTPLTAVAGLPGVDQFQIGLSNNATANNIAAAINLGTNSFTGICTAQVDVANPALVNLRAADPFAGALGNGIILVVVLGTTPSIEINGNTIPTFFSGGADTPNKPTQSTIYRRGNVDADPSVNLSDDIADPVIGTETAKRVQIQYRIRVTGQAEAVNFKTENGFDNANVEAQGTQGAPVAGYPFVPADNSTVNGSSDATAYQTIDNGLWIAGDGSSTAAAALGTIDGFVYAIPICFVFRRNDAYNGGAGAGFDPLNNTNGALPTTHPGFGNPIIGVIPAATSDRPDGAFHDAIRAIDILDLRRQVVPGGLDLKAELESQMTALLDAKMSTWAIDAADKQTLGAGSGDVSTKFLVCNEIGRSAAKGGVSPSSGDTNRGSTVANFDHIRRRFADWAVIEKRIFPIFPTTTAEPGLYVAKASGGYVTWQEGDVIHIDLDQLDATGLGDWLDAPSGAPSGGGNVTNLWPSGTKVTNVLRVIHDDGNYGAAIPKQVSVDKVVGIGTSHIEITLGANGQQANGGLPVATYNLVGAFPGPDSNSPRRIWVELEITYPIGVGTTDTPDWEVTPDATVYPSGPILENDTSQQPDDWEAILEPQFRQGRREVGIEYAAGGGPTAGAGNPVADNIVSDSPLQITFPRRIYGSGVTTSTVTDAFTTFNRPVDTTTTEYGSSSRRLFLQGGSPLSGAGQTQVDVEYYAQDPLPNWGGVGYQVAVYYRSTAPQTVGVQAGAPATYPLPTNLDVRPLVMSRSLWTGTVSAGSVDLPFPYLNPSDQIAVNGDVAPADFPAEWILTSTANISVGDFNAQVGLLNLHTMTPVDPNQDLTFTDKDVDSEFRAHYKISDLGAYRPAAFAQPLSSVATHKVWLPFLAAVREDNVYFRKDEVVLIVLSRFATVTPENTLAFVNTNNTTCAAVYRTRGLLILASE